MGKEGTFVCSIFWYNVNYSFMIHSLYYIDMSSFCPKFLWDLCCERMLHFPKKLPSICWGVHIIYFFVLESTYVVYCIYFVDCPMSNQIFTLDWNWIDGNRGPFWYILDLTCKYFTDNITQSITCWLCSLAFNFVFVAVVMSFSGFVSE